MMVSRLDSVGRYLVIRGRKGVIFKECARIVPFFLGGRSSLYPLYCTVQMIICGIN